MLSHALPAHLAKLQQQGLYRQRPVFDHTWVINFSSNDYLSLAAEQSIQHAYQTGFQRYPAGSSASMMAGGYHAIHQKVEQAFAAALEVDDCILFTSGYAANLSVANLLGHLQAMVVIDKSVHASIYDGLKLGSAGYVRYLHNDLADLLTKIKSTTNTAVITESVFSMSGQLAPLAAMATLCSAHQSELIVDESHAFGILGPQGLGAVAQHQLTQEDVPLRIIPLGKAYAACGAIVAGSRVWIDALLQAARPAIYSTAISPAFAHGLLATLDIVRAADQRRAKLQNLINYFRQAVINAPLKWRDSSSPIQQLQLGCPHRALAYAQILRQQSINCLPIRQPTVSKHESGLRIVLNYNHQPEDIDKLFRCLLAISISDEIKK